MSVIRRRWAWARSAAAFSGAAAEKLKVSRATVGQAKRTAGELKTGRKLLYWTELPLWRQEGSGHIQTGYRPESRSVRECLYSWLYMHNETLNIHSHILGALIFMLLPVYLLVSTDRTSWIPLLSQSRATPIDLVVCGAYVAGVVLCFAISTAFHTLTCHSESVHRTSLAADGLGVIALQSGATVPLVYYTFSGSGEAEGSIRTIVVYLTLTALLAAGCCAGARLVGFWRAMLFTVFGVGSFAAPIGHGLLAHGWEVMWWRAGLKWTGIMVVFNAIGVGFFVTKFPERFFPKQFDLIGASHQIMHIMVVCAALAYGVAVLQMVETHAEQFGHRVP